LQTSFAFVRNASASAAQFPPELTRRCFQRSVALRYQDQYISSSITSNQTPLIAELLLDGAGQIVPATAANGRRDDVVSIDLQSESGVYVGTFGQMVADEPVSDDNILQYDGIDSIIINWRNPDIPLDTIRWAWQVIPYDAVNIESVTYRDTDSDGLIDALEVGTDRPINPAEEEALNRDRFGFPSSRNLTYEGVNLLDGGNGFVISVSQDESDGLVTDVTPQDILRITEFDIGPYDNYVPRGSYPIRDGIAPVLTSITYHPSAEEGEDPILRVTFSEDIEPVTSDQPFRFITSEGEQYTLRLDLIALDGSSAEFRVVSSSDNQIVPASSDSVWISADAYISDQSDNIQIEPNRKRQLTIEFPLYDVHIGAHPNPVRLGSRNRLLKFGQAPGMVIVISPDSLISRVTDLEVEEIRIFDSVGNLLSDEKKLSVKKDKGNLYVHWDGCNMKRRVVAAGTYLALIKVVSELEGEEREHELKIKLGFKQ
ncbi:MAG: hypothetical protein ACLFSB_04625, partial [Chitinispirillaceae bacterium]